MHNQQLQHLALMYHNIQMHLLKVLWFCTCRINIEDGHTFIANDAGLWVQLRVSRFCCCTAFLSTIALPTTKSLTGGEEVKYSRNSWQELRPLLAYLTCRAVVVPDSFHGRSPYQSIIRSVCCPPGTWKIDMMYVWPGTMVVITPLQITQLPPTS